MDITQTLELVPASWTGDFTRAADVRKAWAEGKDFIIMNPQGHGQAINKPDNDRYNEGRGVMIRYAKLQKVIVI